MKEWNAAAYDRLSAPQQAWGRKVLERIDFAALDRPGVRVLDVGAGTGKLTALLAERLPEAAILALDRSSHMIDECRAHLSPRFGDRVEFVEGDALELGFERAFDLIFSTATFHWIHDHERLFAVLARAMRPGGRIQAQCGGRGNLAGTLGRSSAVLGGLGFDRALAGEKYPATFAGAEETASRLTAAGLEEARAWLEPAPTPFEDRETFRAFLEAVVLRTIVARLSPADASRYLDEVVARSEREVGWELDYVRLNIEAKKPDTSRGT